MRTTFILCEGKSYPGGFESGRFDFPELPIDEDKLIDSLRHMLRVDNNEHALVDCWATQGVDITPGEFGVTAVMVEIVTDKKPTLEEIGALARGVADEKVPVLHRVEYDSSSDLMIVARSLLQQYSTECRIGP